jgi:FkbM family methyltransferase
MSVTRSAQALLERTLANAGLRLERLEKPLSRHQEKLGQLILDDQRKKAGDDFFFVQVGACDGVSFDFLYDFVTTHRLKGIAIEPLPDLYKELKANYADYPGVVPLNVGLHSTATEMKMYRIASDAEDLPEWVKGISSMDPEHHKLYNVATKHVVTESVQCTSWKGFVEQHHVTRIDYLQLDTEGYDYEILEMLDLQQLRPAVIKFEHDLPTRPGNLKRFADCMARFIQNDYHVLTLPHDAIAYSHLCEQPVGLE